MSSSPVHRDAPDDAPATLSDREAACDRAVAAAFGSSAHAAVSCRVAATTITAIATAVDALDTVEADDAWADWRGCICGGGAYGEMVACDGGCDNWFHFACVGLAQAPRGEYICDACGAGFGFRRAYDDDEDSRAIACLQENPKKPGTACNLRYEAYKSATTVAEFLEKGGTPADLTHDVGKGFVWYLDADDGRRPRGNQLLPVRLRNVRVLQCGRFAPTGPQTRFYGSLAYRHTSIDPQGLETVLSAARRKRRRLGLPRGLREPPET